MRNLSILCIFFNIVVPCAVCYGDPNHPVTEGMNSAIIFLLFVTLFVLLCIGTSITMLIQRTKKIELKRRLDDR